jgi:D-glycero-alpha-D-manno-heptose 1-phosphate guanylyltransferase
LDALILAGGLGTRLRSVVSDRAKPVAMIGNKPFVLWMMSRLARSGRIRRFIICSGHLAHTVRDALGERVAGVPIRFSEESEPLGTGGALRLAAQTFDVRGPLLALNGDSHLGFDLERMLAAFRPRTTDFMLALARVDSTVRYGRVDLGGSDGLQITAFREKGIEGAGWINAGVYLVSRAGCTKLLAAPVRCSLEQDIFAASLATGRLRGYRSRGTFIDIGVPDDFRRAEALFGRG